MTESKKELLRAILFIVLLGLFIWGAIHFINEDVKRPKPTLKYKVGDVVYLKPDSTKAVMGWARLTPLYSNSGECRYENYYDVTYKTKIGELKTITVSPLLIY
jgi:hypothetical protein